MRGLAVVAAVVLATAGCTSDGDPPAAPSPTTKPVRAWDGKPATAFVLGSYVDPDTSERLDAVAFFMEDGSRRNAVLTLCGAGLAADGRLELSSRCTGPALPKEGRYAGARGSELYFAIDAPETALGERFHYLVVGHAVARGGVFDENGAFHEGRVLGDPSMPARLLVVDQGGKLFAGYRLEDANGRLLEEQHGPDAPVVTPSG